MSLVARAEVFDRRRTGQIARKERTPVGENSYAMTTLFTIKTDEFIALQKKKLTAAIFIQ